MIIDFHTHVFPEKIVEKALSVLSETGGNLILYSDGTINGLIDNMNSDKVEKSVILSIATNEKQMKNVNDFAISLNNYDNKIISFGSVHPLAENAVEELYRIKESGLKGVKFHPEYQDFFVDDPKMAKIYEAINKLDLITVFHAGMDDAFSEPVKASPERFKNMLSDFKTPVVLAHMGGYIMWSDVEKHLIGIDKLYFDTSFCFSRIPLPLMERIVTNHGTDKILFGSDMPWSLPKMEKRLIDALYLTDNEKENIFYKNAEQLLKL